MRLRSKVLFSAFLLGCGLTAGWFAPKGVTLWTWCFESSLSLSRFADSFTDVKRLEIVMELYPHCGSADLHGEHERLEKSVVSGLMKAGKIERTEPGNYRLREKLSLKTFSMTEIAVASFGWVETKEYDEMYYVTPLNYARMANIFKQGPKKSGESEVVISKVITSSGPLVLQVLRLVKTNQGTRVSCREFKGVMQ
jgi:hypothetical protein